MVDVNDELIEEYKEVFERFDTDRDGTIAAKEIGNVLRALGRNVPSPHELQEMLDELDCDGNGTVDFPEFMFLLNQSRSAGVGSWMETHKAEVRQWLATIPDLKAQFALLDVNNDGFVSRPELQTLADSGVLSDSACSALVYMSDTDGDGRIDLGEFKRLGEVLRGNEILKAELMPDPEAEIKKKNEEDARQQLQMISTVYLGSDVHQARMDASVRRDHEFRQKHLQNYLRYPSRSSGFLHPPDEKALQAKKDEYRQQKEAWAEAMEARGYEAYD